MLYQNTPKTEKVQNNISRHRYCIMKLTVLKCLIYGIMYTPTHPQYFTGHVILLSGVLLSTFLCKV